MGQRRHSKFAYSRNSTAVASPGYAPPGQRVPGNASRRRRASPQQSNQSVAMLDGPDAAQVEAPEHHPGVLPEDEELTRARRLRVKVVEHVQRRPARRDVNPPGA